MKNDVDKAHDEEFKKAVGMPLEKVLHLYKRAVENDWRTVQATTQQVFTRFTASRATAAEAAELLKLARSILASENGKHLELAGLPRE